MPLHENQFECWKIFANLLLFRCSCLSLATEKFLNIRTPEKNAVLILKWLYHRVLCPKDADKMANSVDPNQTAPLGAVLSGSALFAQTYMYLSENLGSLG